MENLPVEMITHIIKFLTSLGDRKACSLVCKSWYEAYQDPYFRNFEVLHITSNDRFKVLLDLKNEERMYFYVTVKEIEIGENTMEFWERYGPHIKTLSILSCDIREKSFVSILKKCLQLKSLNIENCRELFMVGNLLGDINERLILGETLNSLTTLNLSSNRYLSDAVFVKFSNTFQNIKNLILSGCQISFFSGLYKKFYPNGQVTPSESVFTFPVVLFFIKNNAHQIKSLTFNDTYINNMALGYLAEIKDLQLDSLHLKGCFELSHAGVHSLCDHQKSLTELDLSLCHRITDGCLMVISCNLPNLVSLSVQKCRAITDFGVSNLCQLKKLNYLNISECDLIVGEGILKGICYRINPDFKELRMNHLRNLTHDVVVRLSKCFPNLKVLDLGFCYKAVTNRSIQSVFKYIKSLETLILTMCEKLSDKGLTGIGIVYNLLHIKHSGPKHPLGNKAEIEIEGEVKSDEEEGEFFVSCPDFTPYPLERLKCLQHLNLSACNGVSDYALLRVFKLQELKTLKLSHCNRITEVGIKHLVANCPSIESLNLYMCRRINNDGVKHILQNLKRLKSFVLGSNKVNDSVAPIISQYGKNIVYLDLRHCYRISQNAIDLIKNSLPKLEEFFYSQPKVEGSEFSSVPVPIGLWLN